MDGSSVRHKLQGHLHSDLVALPPLSGFAYCSAAVVSRTPTKRNSKRGKILQPMSC
jgi:hypothetical protein